MSADASPPPEIETVDSRVVYRNRWMTVREDTIRRVGGALGIYGVVEKRNFAVIAAVQDGRIVLVEQYRYPVGARHWELPQGVWNEEGEDPLAQAHAELREETGLTARSMVHAGRLFQAYGFCTQAADIFLARDLEQHAPELEAEEQGLVARWFALAEVDRMMVDGQIVDTSTVAALGLLRLKGLL